MVLDIDGIIEIKSVETNFQRELESSELRLLTTEDAIANSCLARQTRQTNLTISGNYGTSTSLDTNYSDLDSTFAGVGAFATATRTNSSRQSEPNNLMIPAEKMVETQRWSSFVGSSTKITIIHVLPTKFFSKISITTNRTYLLIQCLNQLSKSNT